LFELANLLSFYLISTEFKLIKNIKIRIKCKNTTNPFGTYIEHINQAAKNKSESLIFYEQLQLSLSKNTP
jgi:hypothetical protein